MLATLVLVLTGVVTVYGDCGHCPTEQMTDPDDLLQAQAYNAMPKHWEARQLRWLQPLGYGRVAHGYGPWKCTKPCEVGQDGFSRCVFGGLRRPKKGNKLQHFYKTGKCVKPYHDDTNQKCIEPPQWNTKKQKMWCKTHQEGETQKGSYTHYPICATTKKMCLFQKTPPINTTPAIQQ